MKYNEPKDVAVALENNKVKVSSIKQNISKLKKKGELDKVSVLEEGLSLWESRKTTAMCTYYKKPMDEVSLDEILYLYDKDQRLLTTNHCVRFTILMTLDSFIRVQDYSGLVLHPRDLYLEDDIP